MAIYRTVVGMITPGPADAWDADATVVRIIESEPETDGTVWSNVCAPEGATEGQVVVIHNDTSIRSTVYGLTGGMTDTVWPGKGRGFFYSNGEWHALQGYA